MMSLERPRLEAVDDEVSSIGQWLIVECIAAISSTSV